MDARELLEALDRTGEPSILIVGDLILDRYVTGDVTRVSPEAPIQILAARHAETRLGGAGNVGANLRAMGARVELVSVVGDDGHGRALVEMLREAGIETRGCVVDPSRPTTEKTRMVSGVQQMLRVDWERTHPVDERIAGALVGGLEARLEGAGAVVLSDYGKGVLTPGVLGRVIDTARAAGVPVLVDPKGADFGRYRGATLVTPNRREAEVALGRRIENLDQLPEAAGDLIRSCELDAAVITLGAEGIFVQTRDGRSERAPTAARAVFDVTGAGDTVIALLAFGLAAHLPLEAAVRLANFAAGIVVGRRGTVAVTRDELRSALAPSAERRGKVLTPRTLADALASWRSEGKRIVFTNGCFDIVHAGHVEYLRFARSKGDVLLVGVNDDASVRRLKGPTRPVNALEDRMHVLAALEMVDAVVPFGEDTPKQIVERVTPDVLVKGEDWRDKGVVGREWVEQHGGEVVLAPLVPGKSTSSILERAGGA